MRALVQSLLLTLIAGLCANAGEIPAPAAQAPQYAEPTTIDRIGCVAAPVYINGQGPFRFVIDTGANHSLISPQLAGKLAIDVGPVQTAMVTGINGQESARIATVAELKLGEIVMDALPVLVLDNPVHTEADGLLGTDMLEGHSLLINFRRNRVDIYSGGYNGSSRGLLTIKAEMILGKLAMIAA